MIEISTNKFNTVTRGSHFNCRKLNKMENYTKYDANKVKSITIS